MDSAEEIDLRRRLNSVTSELLGTYVEIEVLTTVAEIAASNADVAAVGRRIIDEDSTLLQADVAFIIYGTRAEGGRAGPRGDHGSGARRARGRAGKVAFGSAETSVRDAPRERHLAGLSRGDEDHHACERRRVALTG